MGNYTEFVFEAVLENITSEQIFLIFSKESLKDKDSEITRENLEKSKQLGDRQNHSFFKCQRWSFLFRGGDGSDWGGLDGQEMFPIIPKLPPEDDYLCYLSLGEQLSKSQEREALIRSYTQPEFKTVFISIKSQFKNYDNEIAKFADYIIPHVKFLQVFQFRDKTYQENWEVYETIEKLREFVDCNKNYWDWCSQIE